MAVYQKINGTWTNVTNTTAVPTFLSDIVIGYNGKIERTDPSFNVNWTTGSSTDRVVDVGENNVYVAQIDQDAVVKRALDTGVEKWSLDITEFMTSITYDSVNSAAYIGTIAPNVIKVNSSGNKSWSYTQVNANVTEVESLSSGEVLAATFGESGSAGEIHKIDSSGNNVWTYNETNGNNIRSVFVDDNDNIVYGDSSGIRKLANDGSSVVWSKDFNFTSRVVGISADSNGNFFCVVVEGTSGSVAKILSDGTQDWKVGFTRSGNDTAVTNSGRVIFLNGYDGSNYKIFELDHSDGSIVNDYTVSSSPQSGVSFISGIK